MSISSRTSSLLKVATLAWAALGFVLLAGCGARISSDPQARKEIVEKLRAGGGAAGGTAAAQPTGTGWGTLKGVFKLAGSPPSAGELSTGGKDREVCGDQVPNQSRVVDPKTGGVANIIVFARKVSRVYDELKALGDTKPVFDQKQCLFVSRVFGATTQDALVIKNSDPGGHNTSLAPPGQMSSNNLLPPGGEATYKFAKAVAVPVETTCSIHPWMKAYMFAREDPYFAITKPDGSFEIAKLPAGEEIEFQVWHEKPGNTLEAPGISKGKFKRTIPADGVEDLKVIEIPAGVLNQ